MVKIITDESRIKEIFDRRIKDTFPPRPETNKRLQEGRRLKIYYGIDPTGPNIHLGHVVQLLLLKNLYELGHEIILLIGDFTARIGDPSGKDKTRKQLSKKEVEENMKTYLNQIYKVFPKGFFKVKYNSSWLSKLSAEKIIELASRVSVQQMIARNMFRERIEKESPFGIHEFIYPLMQGYDSVAMEVDGEVGGIDQIFNMLIGRDLVKEYLGKDKIVFATDLLVDPATGKKMSKSEGNLIGISNSPKDIFGKVMKISDEMTAIVFRLCTEKDMKWIEDNKDNDPMSFKKELAFELVRMFHNEKEAQKVKEEFEKVFSEGGLPQEIEEVVLDGKEITILDLLEKSGLVESKSEAKRLIEEGGVQINGVKKENWSQSLILKDGEILKVGPRRFKRIKTKPR